MSNALPSLRQLAYLVAVAERLNFTQAAQDCFVTQSTLSSGLKELETALGARLVERDRQSVRMTPLGEKVVERSRALLGAARDLVGLVRACAAPMTGMVRLGAIPTIAPFLLPGLVRRTRASHPALELVLREDRTATLLERLRRGELDFALIALPYDTRGLLVRELFVEELWLISAMRGDERESSRRPKISNLDPERLLLLEEGHCLREHTIEACGLAERANASGIEATSLVTLVQMVESGLGDALLPQMAIDSGLLSGASVLPKRFAPPVPTRRIALVARTSTTRVEEFEFLAEVSAGLAPHASTGHASRKSR
ncbi:MAG: LysR substrate-binding domain-containing protein [Burkholderiaceae bacterium]|nr:LysR substrate-binding domain-containing protein [Burkholderiaceae bacterium]